VQRHSSRRDDALRCDCNSIASSLSVRISFIQELADAELVRRMVEDEQVPRAPDDSAPMVCAYCKSADLGADSVMLEACMHVFCRQCIAKPIAAACRQWRASDAPPGCVECSAPLSSLELRALLTPEDLATFNDRQARSALTDSKCDA
jgi:hypothetical protein